MAASVAHVNVSNGGVPKRGVARAEIGPLGLAGDRQRRSFHGGPERAVSLFSVELLEKLRGEGHSVEPGALGENLTTRGLDFSRLAKGTRLRVGSAVLEITLPAQPCATIARCFKDGDSSRISSRKFPHEARLYARVIVPGAVAAGDPVEVL